MYESAAHGRKSLDVVVRMYRGRPTVFINGKPNALAGFAPFYTEDFYDRYVPTITKLGFDLYFVDVQKDVTTQEAPDGSGRFWHGDRIDCRSVIDVGPDFFSVDKQAGILLDNDPDAYLVVRFNYRPPGSWRRLHPGEFFTTEEGNATEAPSFASDVFWDAASAYCNAVVRYVESQPWSSNVIGYANFQLLEGTPRPVLDGWLFDHNPAMTVLWRDFLRNKYDSVKALRAAHGDRSLSFDNAELPRDNLRGPMCEVSNALYWQTGPATQPRCDYLALVSHLWRRRLSQICKAMKDGVDRNVIFVHDALKQQMLGWNHNGFFAIGPLKDVSWSFVWPEIMSGAGNIGVAEWLENTPGMDGFLIPHDYHARGLGGVYETEGIVDSAVLRGKYFFSEMDTRVSEVNRTDGSSGLGAARNERELDALSWRNFAASFTRGFNSYWHHAWTMGEWIFSEKAQTTLRRQTDVVRASLNWPHATVPGIAVVLDDAAVLETNGSGHFFNEAILWENKMGLARCGVPFRIYLLQDLERDNFPDHRVFYFPNLFRCDAARVKRLREKVLRDGHVVLWGPGSGISDGNGIGTASASELTGFSFGMSGPDFDDDMIGANSYRRVLISNFDHPITRGLASDMILGGPLPYGPVILPTDGIELGTAWVKGGQNHCGLAVKEFGRGAGDAGVRGLGDYASVFTCAVPIPADLWRNMARFAGAHVYCESNDVLLADTSIVALHSLQSGTKRIALPQRRRVEDLVSGRLYSEDTDMIAFDHVSPDTHVFLLKDQ